jgi:hypothetical protein
MVLLVDWQTTQHQMVRMVNKINWKVQEGNDYDLLQRNAPALA